MTAVGSYSSSCSGAVDTNYAISYVAGSVQVDPAPLTVTASSETMVYGTHVPALTRVVLGLRERRRRVLARPRRRRARRRRRRRARWAPTAISCSGAVDPNYDISYVDGSMQVTAAALVVTASSGSMTYGGTVPAITATYSGFVNGDSATSLSAAAHLLDHRHVVEPGRHLPELVLGRGRRQLHHHLRTRVRLVWPRPPSW